MFVRVVNINKRNKLGNKCEFKRISTTKKEKVQYKGKKKVYLPNKRGSCSRRNNRKGLTRRKSASCGSQQAR